MTKSMEQTLTFLEQNVLVNYSDFLNSSEKYNTDAKSMSFTMDSIHEQIEMLNTNLHGITDSITEINLMVGEASRGVNDVAEKNSKIVEMSNNTQAMALNNTTHANGLRKIVERFKLS
jgi:methyl-accepting chemotaxis protein